MTYAEFTVRLKKVGLSKKEFASLSGTKYMSVLVWGQRPSVPKWVPWSLELYDKAKKYDDIIAQIKI